MSKLKFESLSIEITRDCDLTCTHCLRGEKEPFRDISSNIIYSLFDKVSYIHTLTITGGEPSLNPKAIQQISRCIKSRGIDVDNFYIATNAAQENRAFISEVMNLHRACKDNDLSFLDISNDKYHELDKTQVGLILQLKYGGARYGYLSNYYCIDTDSYLLKQGKQETGRELKETEFRVVERDNYIVRGDIYLNCNGNIINGAQWSYKNQEKYKICGVSEMSLAKFKKYAERWAES